MAEGISEYSSMTRKMPWDNAGKRLILHPQPVYPPPQDSMMPPQNSTILWIEAQRGGRKPPQNSMVGLRDSALPALHWQDGPGKLPAAFRPQLPTVERR